MIGKIDEHAVVPLQLILILALDAQAADEALRHSLFLFAGRICRGRGERIRILPADGFIRHAQVPDDIRREHPAG